MKKLIALAAVAACGAALAVESANIVGYATKEIAADTWYMIGCSFQNVNGSNFNIQEFATGMATGLEAEECTAIQVWNGTSLENYIYQIDDEDAQGNYVSHWLNAGGDQVDFETPPGFACWLKSPAACTITVSGQVVDTDVKSIPLAAGAWQLVANPYPIAVTLNSEKMDCSEIATDLEAENCTVLQFWNGTGLDNYIYQIDDEDAQGNYVSHWLNAGGDQVDLPIPVQTGFWIKSPTAGTLKWNK